LAGALLSPERRSILAFPAVISKQGRRESGRPYRGESVSIQLSLTVNGTTAKADVDERMLLVDLLRTQLALTGTHVGCDTAQCGACTVLVDGRAVKSCNVLAAQVNGAKVTTIEGIAAADGTLHPMQAAFKECHGLQCGFCTPGMVMSALDLVARHPNADEAKIREELEGNLCRCTGYQNIVRAVAQGAAAMAK
jgi:aerobic carbon-monoxide dehydrogenase small subunit